MFVLVPTNVGCVQPPAKRRVSSSTIAQTPLEQLPPDCVEKALALLAGGVTPIQELLRTQLLGEVLIRQGLQADEVLDIVHPASATEAGPPSSTNPAAVRYARQLMAQVLWEAELCAAERAGVQTDFEEEGESPSSGRAIRGGAATSPALGHHAVSRPPSAGQQRREVNFERAQAIAKVTKDELEQRWEQKEKALEGVVEVKAKLVETTRERAQRRNRQKQLQREAIKCSQLRKQELLLLEMERTQRELEERVARSKHAQREVADMIGFAAAIRKAVLETNRQRIIQEQQEKLDERCGKANKAQEQAKERRQRALRQRSAGPPELRAARELARRQAQRVARIHEVEREELRQRLESKVPLPGVLPILTSSPPRSRPGSRPTTPGPLGRVEVTDGTSLAAALLQGTLRPLSARQLCQQRTADLQSVPSSMEATLLPAPTQTEAKALEPQPPKTARARPQRPSVNARGSCKGAQPQAPRSGEEVGTFVDSSIPEAAAFGKDAPDPQALPWPAPNLGLPVCRWQKETAAPEDLPGEEVLTEKQKDRSETREDPATRRVPHSAPPAIARRETGSFMDSGEILDELGLFPLAGVTLVPRDLQRHAVLAARGFEELFAWTTFGEALPPEPAPILALSFQDPIPEAEEKERVSDGSPKAMVENAPSEHDSQVHVGVPEDHVNFQALIEDVLAQHASPRESDPMSVTSHDQLRPQDCQVNVEDLLPKDAAEEPSSHCSTPSGEDHSDHGLEEILQSALMKSAESDHESSHVSAHSQVVVESPEAEQDPVLDRQRDAGESALEAQAASGTALEEAAAEPVREVSGVITTSEPPANPSITQPAEDSEEPAADRKVSQPAARLTETWSTKALAETKVAEPAKSVPVEQDSSPLSPDSEQLPVPFQAALLPEAREESPRDSADALLTFSAEAVVESVLAQTQQEESGQCSVASGAVLPQDTERGEGGRGSEASMEQPDAKATVEGLLAQHADVHALLQMQEVGPPHSGQVSVVSFEDNLLPQVVHLMNGVLTGAVEVLNQADHSVASQLEGLEPEQAAGAGILDHHVDVQKLLHANEVSPPGSGGVSVASEENLNPQVVHLVNRVLAGAVEVLNQQADLSVTSQVDGLDSEQVMHIVNKVLMGAVDVLQRRVSELPGEEHVEGDLGSTPASNEDKSGSGGSADGVDRRCVLPQKPPGDPVNATFRWVPNAASSILRRFLPGRRSRSNSSGSGSGAAGSKEEH